MGVGARYYASGEQNLASAAASGLSIVGAASSPGRAWITDLVVGNVGTPADLAGTYIVERVTDEGTNTDVTPTKMDIADKAATMQAGENHTSTEPTASGGRALETPVNHRGTFRWIAPPGGEIVTPATATDGVTIHSLHASATTLWRAEAWWTE